MLIFCISALSVYGQSDTSYKAATGVLEKLNTKTIGALEKKYSSLEQRISKSTTRSLRRLQKQEAKLRAKLQAKDSASAQKLFDPSKDKYAQLAQKLKAPTVNTGAFKDYLPKLDSLQTTMKFLDKAGAGIPGLPTEKLQSIKELSGTLNELQGRLQSAADVKQFIRERKQQLNEQLDKFGLGKELKQLNKEVYYYQQQLAEYKELINDPEKLGKKVLLLVRDLPAFKDFMSRNSQLAQLFRMPGNYGTAQALAGLQTRASTQQLLTSQLGAGSNPQQYLQQQVQQAQGELNKLKDKVNQLGGGSSDMDIPDFKPNNQKTKTFWKRIEYGLNIQSQKTNALLPVTSDIAITAGYKLSDNATIGTGAGYKLGWGKNISNIKISSQGVSLRSYVDIKLKGSIWISGGYEYNYQHEFEKIEQLKDLSAWQKSGLIGVTKKYKVGKKNGNMQLLWDFLSYGQVPQTQPLKFRIGYTF